MSRPNCPGVPQDCPHARSVIDQALDGLARADKVTRLRAELEHCPPCVHALDFEVRFRLMMSQRCREDAPPELQLRVTEALSAIDLGQIDVTDL